MSVAHVYGNDIDTDALAPGRYMAHPLEELARHCLESVDPDFAASVRPGDILIAGTGFGIGSSREQAAQALKHLGIGAIVARSFGGIFYRNALNIGLPVFRLKADEAPARTGDRVQMNIETGLLTNLNTGAVLQLEPLPGFLLQMVQEGGLVPHLEKRFAAATTARETPK